MKNRALKKRTLGKGKTVQLKKAKFERSDHVFDGLITNKSKHNYVRHCKKCLVRVSNVFHNYRCYKKGLLIFKLYYHVLK